MTELKKINFSKISFEEAMNELEDIVSDMEDGDLPLDNMIATYEQGAKLVAFCNKKLQSMEKRIEVLTQETSNGGEWQDFDKSSERDVQKISQEDDDKVESDDLPF